nr:GcrA family cell cycle regulator [uncultured Rhodopila sp.]
MVWNEETIRHLRDLWAEGHSTAEIGRRLGVSKNAIVGKAHRLDLDARPSPIRREGPKPLVDRSAAYPRVAGPTLPPLASAIVPAHAVPGYAAPVHAAPRPAAPRPVAVEPGVPVQSAAVSNVQPLRALSPAPARPMAAPSPAPVPPPRPVAPPSVQPRRSAAACCWPIGEPGTKTFRFCDDTSLPGKPYCDEHAKLAYVRIRDRKEDAA